MRRVLGMSAACAALVLSSHGVLAQSLTSVPDNAVAMIKVNNLEGTNKKLGTLFQAWGIAAMNPMLADPLAGFKGMTNVDKGLNTAGEAALVLINRQGQGEGEPYIVIVPVTDYAAFITNFEGATTDQAITSITMPQTQEPAYVANWGSFAAISPDRSLIAAKPNATKVTGMAAKEMAGKDVVAYINFPGFKQQANMGLGFGQMMMAGQIDQGFQQNPDKAKYGPVAKAAVSQLFKGLQHFVNETQAMTIGASLSNEGVQLTYMAEFVPQSYLGGLVQQWKSAGSTIAGLPENKYAIVGNTSWDPKVISTVINDAANPVVDEANKLGPELKPVADYVDSLKQVLASSTSQTIGMSVGEGKPGQSPLFEMVSVITGDAPKILAAQKQMVASQDMFQQALQQPGQPKVATTFTEGVKTVGGVKFDQVVAAVEPTQQGGPEQKMIEAIYGPGGLSFLWGAVTPQTVISSTLKDDARLTQAITAAKAAKPMALDTATKEASAKLPQKGFATLYMYGDQMLALVSRGSQAVTGTPLQMQLPANQMPIVMTASTEGTAVRGDLFIPSTLVQSITQAAMQQQMKQGQQQNQGGGL
jgi:hypothetical protein